MKDDEKKIPSISYEDTDTPKGKIDNYIQLNTMKKEINVLDNLDEFIKEKQNEGLSEQEIQKLISQEIQKTITKATEVNKSFVNSILKIMQSYNNIIVQYEKSEVLSGAVKQFTDNFLHPYMNNLKMYSEITEGIFNSVQENRKDKPLTTKQIDESIEKLQKHNETIEKYKKKIDSNNKTIKNQKYTLFDKLKQSNKNLTITDEQIEEFYFYMEYDSELPESIFEDYYKEPISKEIQIINLNKNTLENLLNNEIKISEETTILKLLLEKDIGANEIESIKEWKEEQETNNTTLEIRIRHTKEWSFDSFKTNTTTRKKLISYTNQRIKAIKEKISLYKKINTLKQEFIKNFYSITNPHFENKEDIDRIDEIRNNYESTYYKLEEIRKTLLEKQSYNYYEREFTLDEYINNKTEEEHYFEILLNELNEEEKQQSSFEYKPSKIDKEIISVDKVTKGLVLAKNNYNMQITNLLSGKNKNKNITLDFILRNDSIKTSEVLEDFDRYVIDTIETICQKDKVFDIQGIKKQLTQKNDRHKSKLDEYIEKSLDKLSQTKIKFNIPEELNELFDKNLIPQIDKIKSIEMPLFTFGKIQGIKGGETKELYILTQPSPYLTIRQALNQKRTINNELLMIDSPTKEKIVLKMEIISRIEDMKYQKEHNSNNSYIKQIRFDSLFKKIKLEREFFESDKQFYDKKYKIKKYIFDKILTHCKKSKQIKSFKEYSEGIEITL